MSALRRTTVGQRLDLCEFERKLPFSPTLAVMPTSPNRPIIFISYAHADEPEKPAEGEIKWLSFVTGYLRPAEKQGAAEVWTDRLMHGGDDWNPEIESKLRACDIFVLLVSPNSTGSDYIVDKEIAIIRERQASGEYVHFYPLLLTPTPKSGLDMVRDKNLRPRDGKPFSSFSYGDRQQQMSDAADEIVRIAAEIAARKTGSPLGLASLSSAPSPPGEEKAREEAEIGDRQASDAAGARSSDGGGFAMLTEWALDWLQMSSTAPAAKAAEGSPNLVPLIFAAAVTVLAAFSSPAISASAPNLNSNAALLLRILIAVVALIAVNHVVTAKEEGSTGFKSQTIRRYRFSNTARFLAESVGIIGMGIWALAFARDLALPKDCELTALMTWTPSDTPPSPLYVEIAAGELVQFAVGNGIPVAFSIPAAQTSDWTLTILWSDRTRSKFGKLTECYEHYSKESDDRRALLSLESR